MFTMPIARDPGKVVRIVLIVLSILSYTPYAFSQTGDQIRAKQELYKVINQMRCLPAEDRERISKLGDVFEAALAIFRDEESAGENGSHEIGMVCIRIMIRDKTDPRAAKVFLPYLRPARPHYKPWMCAIEVALRTHHAESERWIKDYLESTPDDDVRAYIIERIRYHAGPHWIEYLTKFRSALNAKERDEVGCYLEDALRDLNERLAKSEQPNAASHSPDKGNNPANTGPESRPLNAAPDRRDRPPNNAVHVPRESGDSSTTLLIAVIAIACAVLLLAYAIRKGRLGSAPLQRKP